VTAPARFRLLRRFLGPKWLVTDGESGLVGYSLDVVKDAFIQRLMLGLIARFPHQDASGRPAPSDALAAQGRDRRVTRGLAETGSSYAGRLLRWLDDSQSRGAPFALLQKLSEYTGPGPSFRTVDARGNWYSRAADGTESAVLNTGNWNWDGPIGARWSRFWVVIYPNGLWSEYPNDWGDAAGANWGEGLQTWGSTATPENVQTIRSIVADWKPQGTRCVNIILAFDPASFNPATPEPDGLWASWSKNVAGVQVPARLSTARYWDGV
jgi:hypothetical protein